MSAVELGMPIIELDAKNLYREETLTDMGSARLRVLVPLREDGSPDPDREVVYFGHATLLTPVGQVPVDAPIEAKTLQEAVAKLPNALQVATAAVIAQLRELRRQAASQIVVPDTPLGPMRPKGRG